MKRYFLGNLILVLAICSCNEEKEETSITFIKGNNPVWEGEFTAADPDVVRDGDTLRMYYSSLVIDGNEKLIIASAKSVDGKQWIPSDNNQSGKESIALDANPDNWNNHIEANSVIVIDNKVWIYYCCYK